MKHKNLLMTATAALWLFVANVSSLAGLWTPEDFGDRLWLDWWQEDLANGSVATWTTRKGAVAATGAAGSQPTKGSGEVYFASGQRLTFPGQGSGFLAHRAMAIIFRIDLTGSANGSIFAANGYLTSNYERQPILRYDAATNQVQVGWRTQGGQNLITWTLAENASQWHCVVTRRVGNMHYASLDGAPEVALTMADYAVPKNAATGYIGDFDAPASAMAIDSVMIVQDEMTQAEAEKLMGWAMWRKGLQASLPAGHPYKDQPPMAGNDRMTFADVGTPLPAGSTTITPPENFQISAGGTGFNTSNDNFHFAYQAIEGDCELIVKVDSLTNTNANARAGVVLRGNLTSNAASAGIFVRPGTNGVTMHWRNGTGSASTTNVTSLSLPRWVKLVRTGANISGYHSSDGSTWTLVNTVTPNVPKKCLGGIAATSAVQSTATTAQMSALSIHDSRPVYTFVESTPAEWQALLDFWNNTTLSEQGLGTVLNLNGWKVNFEDNFDTHSVTNENTGEGPWYAPTHGAPCGAAAAVIPTDAVPEGSPSTYIHSPGEMTIRMQQVGVNWKSGAFCSVNSNGYGRTWKYPYIEARMKATPGNYKGAWPALWIKSENFFYNLTESNLEYDSYEGYVSDEDGFHNAIHNWPAQRKLPDRLQAHRARSNYLRMKTPGWYQNVNLFDNAYHTYGVMITPEWVINMFDGREMFRFPTPIEMKQPMWTLVDLALLPSEEATAVGPYELTIDYIKIYQNPAFAGAAIKSTFTDGAGTDSADQYPGVAEDGWATTWTEHADADMTVTVANTTPLLTGTTNYLQVVNGDTTTGSSNDGIARRFSSANGVTLTAPHTVTFDYRLDSPVGQLTGSDTLTFMNATSPTMDAGSGTGYMLGGYYDGSAFQWRWYNGDKAGAGTWSTSGMPIVTGVTYHVELALDPVNKQYTAKISNGTTTVTSPTLGYRTANAAPVSLDYLIFSSRDLTSGQTITQSLDSVTVSP